MTLKAWLIALSVARAFDAMTTCDALSHGAVDVNGLIHNCPTAIVVPATMTLVQAVTLTQLSRDGHEKAARWIARVSTWAELAIGAHNIRVSVVMRDRR